MSIGSLRISRGDRAMAAACALALAAVFGVMAYGARFAAAILPVFFCFLVMRDLRYGVFLYPLFYLFDSLTVPSIGSPPKLLSLLVLFWFIVKRHFEKKTAPSGDWVLGALFASFIYVGVISAANSQIALKDGLAALQSIFLKGLLAYMVFRIIPTRKDLYTCFNSYFAMQMVLILIAGFLVFYYRQPYILRMFQTDVFGKHINLWADKFPLLNMTLIQFPNIVARAMLAGLPFIGFFVRTTRGNRRAFYLLLFILSCAKSRARADNVNHVVGNVLRDINFLIFIPIARLFSGSNI